jgi:starch-binding outer membrane protein, SusD/RagB family
MTRFNYFTLVFLALLLVSSCSKKLDLTPQDTITNAQYWNQPNDLTLYVNQFYTAFPVNSGYFVSPFWADINSDDMIPGTFDMRLAGRNTISSNNSSWNFANIRSVNYGLENYGQIPVPFSQISSGVGELNFFRAYFYFNLVKLYGDVPWLSHTINIDSKELYNPRTKRNIVIDSVLADLDKAIAYLPLKASASANRLNKECALLFKSRVALYEGSWEKYHASTPFGVNGADPSKYFHAAADAASALIGLGTLRLYVPTDPNNYFRQLFGNTDLSSNPEILLWKKYITALGMGLHIQGALYQGGDRGLSKSLVESFLCKDGLPISKSPLYKGDATLTDVATNRDPRLSQSMWVPGQVYTIQNNVVLQYFTLPWIDKTGELRNTSGYQLAKGRTTNMELAINDGETASIIFRYAEALLNYAEAKAELNEITQADVDISINLLRRRVQMPDMKLNAITTDPNWLYPQLSPAINEIRRERRVELACEGYRFDDLERWADIDRLVNQRPLGAIFKQSDFPSLVPGTNIYINPNGYIDPYQKALTGGYKFNPARDYLLPIPQLELTLNKNLTQNPGW